MPGRRKDLEHKTANEGKSARVAESGRDRGASAVSTDHELTREFVWDIVSINTHLEDIRYIWARVLGVSGPQWLILMAVNDLDRGGGVSVGDVSTKLHVDSSFVTVQTKSLEKLGFMRRVPSTDDARVVLLSLTDKTYKAIASLSSRQEALNDFVFSDLDERSLRELTENLRMLRIRLEKASLRLAAEI